MTKNECMSRRNSSVEKLLEVKRRMAELEKQCDSSEDKIMAWRGVSSEWNRLAMRESALESQVISLNSQLRKIMLDEGKSNVASMSNSVN